MRIVHIRERTVPISRYADAANRSGDLTTTIVAIITDVVKNGSPVVGYGFASFGRFAQGGLMRDRFIPRLLDAQAVDLASDVGDIDPFRAWDCMMQDEKPGGHGERSVAVGTLDMALWDLASKLAGRPLYRLLGDLLGPDNVQQTVKAYASGGYHYPSDELKLLEDEAKQLLDKGYTHLKIKIGGTSVSEDIQRIKTILDLLPDGQHLAVDAMSRYDSDRAVEASRELAPYGLRWLEDICDPLDYATLAEVARIYPPPLAAGEALFSCADARNLILYGGLRSDRDILVFDPVHSYGLPEYLSILDMLDKNGWPRSACQPHGGHLFCLHIAAALGIGGCESNPHNFQPFGGFADGSVIEDGVVRLSDAPGIGFETRRVLKSLFESLLD